MDPQTYDTQEMGGDDLDFKIEIGDNTDEAQKMDSMGSGKGTTQKVTANSK